MGTILTVLSKVSDSLPHDLVVAKSEAYDIDKNGLNLIHNYLTNRKQRMKISSSYSDWYDILRGVLQGSILGPLFLTYLLMISFFLLKELKYAILLMIIQYVAVILICKLF